MAFKLIWSPSARFDIKDIAMYIAEDNPTAAINRGRTLNYELICPGMRDVHL